MDNDHGYLPISGMDLPRFAGVPSFMRLPMVDLDSERANEVQIGLVGVPWDGGTTNRPGARHGPRQLRDLSTMIRLVNQATLIKPFHLARCADIGDVSVNPADVQDTLERVKKHYDKIRSRQNRADDRRWRSSDLAAGPARFGC